MVDRIAAARREYLAEVRQYAGYRSAHFNRQTGTLIVVVSGAEQGLDGKWVTICDDHDQCVGHDTLALAQAHAAAPLGWCEVCNGTDQMWSAGD